MFDNFDPTHYATLREKARKGKPNPDLIRAIAEAELHSAQAELQLIVRASHVQEIQVNAIELARLKKQKGK